MEINNITYSYDLKNNHLDNISGSINSGQVTTIIGPNGCGKSTLLGVIAKSYTPHKGHIILDGKKLSSFKAKELARKVAVVYQGNRAPIDMMVEKLVGYGRLPHQTMFSSKASDDEKAVEWALKTTNLDTKRNLRMEHLSGGEQQRVWIAMALAQSTPYLFLDEPTTYLDMYYQYEILELVKQLNQEHGMTIVMVLHDINQAIRYSDTIIAMKEGRVIKQGSPQKIITKELIKDVYHVDVEIIKKEKTGLHIIPIGI